MDKITCTLTDKELADKVKAELDKMIKTGGKSFTMQVPARVNDDTDLLIAELLTRFRTNEKAALNIGVVRLSLPDRMLFNKFNHKEYGGLDLAYRLLEKGLIRLEAYEEMKDGVSKYIKSNEA